MAFIKHNGRLTIIGKYSSKQLWGLEFERECINSMDYYPFYRLGTEGIATQRAQTVKGLYYSQVTKVGAEN